MGHWTVHKNSLGHLLYRPYPAYPNIDIQYLVCTQREPLISRPFEFGFRIFLTTFSIFQIKEPLAFFSLFLLHVTLLFIQPFARFLRNFHGKFFFFCSFRRHYKMRFISLFIRPRIDCLGPPSYIFNQL